MSIAIRSASKTIQTLMKSLPGVAIKGLQPQEAKKIRRQIMAIQTADSMVEIKALFPAWDVHRWHGDEKTWSFTVGGATRLLMEWDADRKEVSNVRFDNPH
jgi:plasmid maintenance system killer protein